MPVTIIIVTIQSIPGALMFKPEYGGSHRTLSGKAELNFSEFGDYSNRRQRSKLNSIAKTVEDGTMPFSSYTLMHSEARLTKEEKALIIHWANTTKDSLSLKN